MDNMPAAFQWDKVTRIDPVSLSGSDKDHVDEVFSMLTLVIVHTSHQC